MFENWSTSEWGLWVTGIFVLIVLIIYFCGYFWLEMKKYKGG